MRQEEPNEANEFWADHTALLERSFRHWTGQSLIDGEGGAQERARALFEAPFALVSHGTEPDPIFNYANRTALTLFEMDWSEFTRLPSRLSAEPLHRDERQRLMDQVSRRGFITDYRGVRISRTGRRFQIERATVWNLLDAQGVYCGQAAMFSEWRFLPATTAPSDSESPLP